MSLIYLNQAGTTWPKPRCVQQACAAALQAHCDEWPEQFDVAHAKLARFLGLATPERLLLTPGCTSSLAVAIQDLPLQPGDRILTSSFEHHAMHRPLLKWVEHGVELEVIPPSEDAPLHLDRLEASLQKSNVKLVAVTAASNVTGDLLPIESIVDLAHQHHAWVLVDGAQWIGWENDIRLPETKIDLLAFGGHKALHAPWGIGGLYVAPHVSLNTPQATCEISTNEPKCTTMPGYCDAGSVDRIALHGLAASLNWLEERPTRLAEGQRAVERLRQVLEAKPGIVLYGTADGQQRLPTLAFNILGMPAGEIAKQLLDRGLSVASGLQCAPLAHEILGTAPEGAVRLSVGPLNDAQEIEQAVEILDHWRPSL